MASKRQLLEIRTNSSFIINYNDLTLSPQIELIMLFAEPKYKADGKGTVTKGHELNEFRLNTTKEGISQVIGELQNLQLQLNTMDNLSEGVNAFIRQNTKSK